MSRLPQIASPFTVLRCLAATLLIQASAAFGGPIYNVTDLGTVPGVTPTVNPGDYPLIPRAVNASGEVVGTWLGVTQSGGPVTAGAFLYTNGQMTDVTASGANGKGINDSGTMTRGTEVAINNSGDTTGWGPLGSYVNTNGSSVVLPFGFLTFAINDRGVVVGGYQQSWAQPGQIATYDAGKIATFGPANSGGFAINNAGQIVGSSPDGYTSSALYYNGSGFRHLGDLGGGSSIANAINNAGQIVGSGKDAKGNIHAFLSVGGNPMVDLNTLIDAGLGWEMITATAINDRGVIVGYGRHNGQLAGFELTPISQAVPEPTTLALPCFCALYLGYRRLSRRSA